MKMQIIILFIVVTLLLIVNLPAQDFIKGKSPLRIEVDFARFYGDSTQAYVEMYYGIHEDMMSYKRDSNQFVGVINMRREIWSKTLLIAKKEWTVPHSIADTAQLQRSQVMVGLQSVGLPPGDYIVSLVLYDALETSRRDSFAMPLHVISYPIDREFLSDVEFCTSIQSSTDKSSMFYKNTLEVIPNASKLYGTGLPIMYYYTTVYNLTKSQSTSKDVNVRTSVVDAFGKEIITKDKNKPRLYNSSVEVGTVNLSALKTGTYLFRVSLLDSAKSVLTLTEKKFFVYKYGSVVDSAFSFAASEEAASKYSIMTEQELDLSFQATHYIASDIERNQYESLGDIKAKQKFLFDFWKRRDPDPLTPVNEFEQAYTKRMEYVKEHFAAGFREGLKTDRGRVYLIYGQYDEIERYPSSSESNPYEIWTYNNIQGGVIFVFVDRSSLGDYVLVHSTHREELHNERWYEEQALKAH